MTSRMEAAWADFNERRVQSVTRDLSRIPNDVEALEVEAKSFTDWDGLAARRKLRRLSIGPVKPEVLPHLAALQQIEGLWLSEVRVERLDALAGLRNLRDLAINWAPKLSTLAGIAGLTGLRSLWLWDVPRVTVLDDLAGLAELRELRIETAPSRDAHGPQRFPSLAPLSQLARLEMLHLTGIASQDGSLTPVGGLRHLRHIHLPNTFALAEFATLAGALPNARGNFSEPVWKAVGLVPCRTCGDRKVVLLGSGSRLRCPVCEAARIAAHVSEFERIRSAGSGANARNGTG